MTPLPQRCLNKQKIIEVFEELYKDEYFDVDPLQVRITYYLDSIKEGDYDCDCASCPAPSEQEIRKDEREKVLDEGIELIQKRIDGIFEAYRGEENKNLTELPFTTANGMGQCIIMLKKLRSKQGEQVAQQAGLK